jgi:alpha-L-fucosidase
VLSKSLDWNENGIPESWKRHWFDRIKDLVDQYEPDLLYCDGHLPFEEYGQQLLAHFYNKSAAVNGGKTQAVYTSKRPEDSARGTGVCVFDVERGVVENIWPLAWQTDTCIGDWHYNRESVGHYKTPKTVVDLLVDIVSRNGNLMLNIPLPASGMPDADELAVLDEIGKWMAVNSEGIYSTRPWKIFGEGPRVATAPGQENAMQPFNESRRKLLTYEDVRFTTRGDVLYAFFMGWPEGQQVVIRPLSTVAGTAAGATAGIVAGAAAAGNIEGVELLGYGKVEFTRDEVGLKVMLPAQRPCEYAYALKISGRGMV